MRLTSSRLPDFALCLTKVALLLMMFSSNSAACDRCWRARCPCPYDVRKEAFVTSGERKSLMANCGVRRVAFLDDGAICATLVQYSLTMDAGMWSASWPV